MGKGAEVKFYTGIGSRETPEDVQKLFIKIAEYLDIRGYTLRSGHAQGADQAFEKGCDKAYDKKEIYIPWQWFQDSDSDLYEQSKEAFKIASKYHPMWDKLERFARKIHARNVHQVLGKDCKTPSNFVLCIK